MAAPTITALRITGSMQQNLQGILETISYEVEADLNGKVMTPGDVAALTTAARSPGASGITLPTPMITSLAGTWGLLLCKSCKWKKDVTDGKTCRWDVVFDNTPVSQQDIERQSQPNPILRLAETWLETDLIDRPVRYDKDSKPLVNTAGVEPLEPLMVPMEHERLYTEAKFASRPDFFDTLRMSINSEPVVFLGKTYAAKTLRFIAGPISRRLNENGYSFRNVTWYYDYASDNWPHRLRRLSTGYEFRDTTDLDAGGKPKLKKIKLLNGEEPRVPMMLDNSGRFIDNQEITAAVYKDSNIFSEVDYLTAFGGIPLPGLGAPE